MNKPLAIPEKKKKQLALILSGNFPYGFRVGSMIDRNRFRACYVSKFGSELEQSDEEIIKMISSVGMMRENRVFSMECLETQDKLTAQVVKDIVEVFNQGGKSVYFSELFKKYLFALTSQLKIYSIEVFRSVLLEKLGGRYSFNEKCVYVGSENEVFQEINEFIRSSSVPVTCKEIHEVLWYIPVKVISEYLKSARPKEFITAGKDRYFCSVNLPVMPEELEQIQDIISSQLEVKAYISVDELREIIIDGFPSISMSIENFTNRAFYNSLSFLLKDKFLFNRSLISNRVDYLDCRDLVKKFCNAYDELTLEKLKDFFKAELHKDKIQWNAVFDVMLRVSKNRFVQRKYVSFDITELDRAIGNVLGNRDYMSLQELNMLMIYPNDGNSWNKYLLESYSAGFSWNFELIHLDYYEDDCLGAVVRKNSGIKDFQMLITRALTDFDAWQTRNDVVEFLVSEGYLQKAKRFKGIDAAIAEAEPFKRRMLRIA